MQIKRTLKGRFEPLFGKENTKNPNLPSQQLPKSTHSTQPSIQILSVKQKVSKRLPIQKISPFTQPKTKSHTEYQSETTKKILQENGLAASYSHDEKQNDRPIDEESNSKFTCKPRLSELELIYRDENEEDNGWKFDVIEVKKPDNFSDSQISEDDFIEKWDQQFKHYDMEEDQQNMFWSDDEESDFGSQNQDYQQSLQNSLNYGENHNELLKKNSTEKPKLLEKIEEVDETTNISRLF